MDIKKSILILSIWEPYFSMFLSPSFLPRQLVELVIQAGFLTPGSNFDFLFP
jgi:hypothetical protein